MKFVHMADMHFDAPFAGLSDRGNLGKIRRMEQRKAFNKIIEYIKENNIEYLFIAGDLYEEQNIQEETIKYIVKKFKEIWQTEIYIAPGNHDPYLAKSYYATYPWSENVHIFKPKMQKIETEEVDIYGYGFGDYYCTNSGIEELEIENKEKNNILIIHGQLNGANIEEKQYNSMSEKMLKEKGFDYIALGHVHKNNISSSMQKIVYPGSTISMGFDELGKHGIVVGEIKNKKVEIQFMPIDEVEFKEENIDCTEIYTKEQLIEEIEKVPIQEKEICKIRLIGKRNFEIDTEELYEYELNAKIIKIKDETEINYNLEAIAQQANLRGIFVRRLLEQISQSETEEDRKILEKAIEIGLDVL